jgi:hypothetical protein
MSKKFERLMRQREAVRALRDALRREEQARRDRERQARQTQDVLVGESPRLVSTTQPGNDVGGAILTPPASGTLDASAPSGAV